MRGFLQSNSQAFWLFDCSAGRVLAAGVRMIADAPGRPAPTGQHALGDTVVPNGLQPNNRQEPGIKCTYVHFKLRQAFSAVIVRILGPEHSAYPQLSATNFHLIEEYAELKLVE